MRSDASHNLALDNSSERIARYSLALIVGYLALLGIAIAIERRLLIQAIIVAPVFLALVSSPRLAIGLFIASLFVVRNAISGTVFLVSDVVAFGVIITAIVDITLHPQSGSRRLPQLTLGFLLIVFAMCVAGIVNQRVDEMIRPTLRVTLMAATFLALIRLLRHCTIRGVLHLFIGIGVINALIAITQFTLSSGAGRTFAFAPHILDELLMLAFPVSIAGYLYARQKHIWLALGSIVIFLGLLATQSRAPILFALLAGAITLWVARRHAVSHSTPNAEVVLRRVRRVFYFAILSVAALLILNVGLFESALGRFNRLVTTDPSGTYLLRIKLWGMALQAFSANPLFGLGPGSFKLLAQIFPAIRLDPTSYWVGGLSAHSLLLHYLAETGILGGIAIMTLFTNQFRIAFRNWRNRPTVSEPGERLALLTIALLLFVTSIFEAGWLWAHTSYIAALFMALTVSLSRRDGAS